MTISFVSALSGGVHKIYGPPVFATLILINGRLA